MKTKKLFLAIAALAILFIGCEKEESVTGISITPDKATLTELDATTELTATLAPSGAKADVIWTSSNPEIATVTGNGLKATVTAKKNGTVNITAQADIFTATAAVTVNTGTTPGGEGNGSAESPYNVAQVLAFYEGSELPKGVWVQGYMVAGVTDDATVNAITEPSHVIFNTTGIRPTAVFIADSKDETDYKKCVIVNLPTGNIRSAINLLDNPGNLKKNVAVRGNLARYFAVPGVRDLTEFKLEGYTPPVVPGTPNYTNKFLDETLLTETSYNKFTAVSVSGEEAWTFSTQYGAMMSGFANNSSHTNEDWFISPEINLAGQTGVLMSFDHARGPVGSITVGIAEGWYKVYATSNYKDVSTTTWIEVTGAYHGTGPWSFVSSGGLTIPSSAISATTRIAFKYICTDAASATWEIKNVVVGK